MNDIETIAENFEFLDDWEDRYKYLIELGNALEPFPESCRDSAHKVNGCVSQVWIVANYPDGEDPIINFKGDSDAHIVRGLIAITLAIFSGRTANEIAEIDEQVHFQRIGLQEHITPQRSNGLRSMVNRIKQYAAQSANNSSD